MASNNSSLWCVVIEDESGVQEVVAEGLSEKLAREHAEMVESVNQFWAEARREF